MLWLRYWLEVRERVVFVVAWSAFFLFGVYDAARDGNGTQVVRAFIGQTTFIALLGAGILAGSGVRTQASMGRPVRGLHGSMYFTLTLPVSRRRLLLTRAAVGLGASGVLLSLLSLGAWAIFEPLRVSVGPAEVIAHAVFLVAGSVGLYGLMVLTSTVLAEQIHILVASATVMVPFLFRAQLPRSLNLVGTLIEGSPAGNGALPLGFLTGSILAGGLFMLAAVRVLERLEY